MGGIFQTSSYWLRAVMLWGRKENHECDCVYVRMLMYVHCKYYSSRGKGFLTCQKVRLYFKVLQLWGKYPNFLGSSDIHTSVIAMEAMKKTQTENRLDMENLGKLTVYRIKHNQ